GRGDSSGDDLPAWEAQHHGAPHVGDCAGGLRRWGVPRPQCRPDRSGRWPPRDAPALATQRCARPTTRGRAAMIFDLFSRFMLITLLALAESNGDWRGVNWRRFSRPGRAWFWPNCRRREVPGPEGGREMPCPYQILRRTRAWSRLPPASGAPQ